MKSLQKLNSVRTFVLVHTKGQEIIFAETPLDAKLQGRERLLAKGLHPQKDWKKFYEVRK